MPMTSPHPDDRSERWGPGEGPASCTTESSELRLCCSSHTRSCPQRTRRKGLTCQLEEHRWPAGKRRGPRRARQRPSFAEATGRGRKCSHHTRAKGLIPRIHTVPKDHEKDSNYHSGETSEKYKRPVNMPDFPRQHDTIFRLPA